MDKAVSVRTMRFGLPQMVALSIALHAGVIGGYVLAHSGDGACGRDNGRRERARGDPARPGGKRRTFRIARRRPTSRRIRSRRTGRLRSFRLRGSPKRSLPRQRLPHWPSRRIRMRMSGRFRRRHCFRPAPRPILTAAAAWFFCSIFRAACTNRAAARRGSTWPGPR